MLWVKALHVFFVMSWFAGLLYLPRLFVYHAMTNDDPGRQRFQVMEKKLFIIMTVGALGSIILGGWLLIAYAWSLYGGALWWLHTKLALVAALLGYHLYCYRIIVAFRRQNERHSPLYFRWMNEVPAVILLAVLILTIVKPF
tara:strand:+ start:127 stop:552 length:426 start_codon:yes stop_codon:yes gene_type:complete